MSREIAMQSFIAESRELLQIMEAALLCVEQGKMDADILGAVCSTANTIKGNAGLFGLAQVVGFIHVTESVLAKVRAVQVRVDRNLSLLLECIDHIGVLIEDLEHGISPSESAQMRCNELTHRLVLFIESDLSRLPVDAPAKVIEDASVVVEPISRFSDYLDLLQACSRQEIRFEEMLKRFGVLTQTELTRLLQRQLEAGADPRKRHFLAGASGRGRPSTMPIGKPFLPSNDGVIPVESGALHHLLGLLDELVAAGNGAQRLARRAGDAELEATASSLSRLADEIRDSSLKLGGAHRVSVLSPHCDSRY